MRMSDWSSYVCSSVRVGPHVGARGDAFLVGVAAVLAAHHGGRLDRADLAEQLAALVAQGRLVGTGRRLHGQQGDDLQQVVLHDVSQRADRLVDPAPTLARSAENTSELQSIMRLSYDVFCLNKQIHVTTTDTHSPIILCDQLTK